MKKLVSILLALAMILTISITAFAEDTQITFENSDQRIYNGYQLLTLSISEKPANQHECDGTNHTDKCYNYRYEVNEQYLEILQAETFNYGLNYVWTEDDKPASADLVTEEQIKEYLEKHTSDEGDVSGNMRQVADRIYRAIQKDTTIDPELEAVSATVGIEKGYWMFADVTEVNGATDEANSLVFVDTKGNNELVITPKVSVPTLEKKVKDIDDSEDADILDNAWYDSADHDMGDTVPFKLTATLPSNYKAFHRDVEVGGVTTSVQYYTMVFHDEMAAGLTLEKDSFKVLQYETKYRADVDTDLNNFVEDVTAYFTLVEDPTDGCSFEVVCENIFAIPNLTKDTAFVVYYEAVLENTAEIGAAGNPNQARLEYSNDPYSTSTGFTNYDKVTVFTYALEILKTDAQDNALAGATFQLSKKNLNGGYTVVTNLTVSDDGTEFLWKGLDDGDYKLEELTPPEGYNAIQPMLFSITAAHSETADEPALTALDGGIAMGTGTPENGMLSKKVVNNTGVALPETGAEGTFFLLAGGALLVMVAAVFMITRKKMSIYED